MISLKELFWEGKSRGNKLDRQEIFLSRKVVINIRNNLVIWPFIS
jgi:hypothetical protein